MPPFLVRGLARYFAVSYVAGSSGSYGDYKSDYPTDYIRRGISAWNRSMRWLLPFVKSTGYRVVIENPKSNQQIIIDQHTTEFPLLTEKWLRKYDKRKLREWLSEDKRKFREWKKHSLK